jgi:predicted transcriptional regulator
LTQKQIAAAMHVSQANISRIEHGEDAQLSTIRNYVNALGGRLEVRAVFPDRSEVLSSQ